MDGSARGQVLERTVRALVSAVDDVQDAGQACDVRTRDGLGLNTVDFSVLRWVDRVRRRGGTTRVGDVADRFGVSSGSATEIVHRLTRAGLLQRQPDPADARVRRLVPTRAADTQLQLLVGAIRAELDGLLATISEDEERRIVELLETVCDILRAEPSATSR